MDLITTIWFGAVAAVLEIVQSTDVGTGNVDAAREPIKRLARTGGSPYYDPIGRFCYGGLKVSF